jgi:hypothetical protein
MLGEPIAIDNLQSLRDYVHRTLCEQNELEVGAFRMTERILVRQGKPCGIYFCLHGPRSVKLTAIWETDRHTILFYGSDGQRQLRTRLVPHHNLVPAIR